jgi:YVTN family beta-propeller protein
MAERRAVRFRAQGAVLGCLAGVLLAGGVAWAVIPSSANGQIYACYNKTAAIKTLRVIDYPAQHCSSAEAMLSWPSHGVRWRGTYAAGTAYAQNDLVQSGGSSYVAVRATTGHAPPNAAYWAVFAAKGSQGPQGDVGPTGPKGDPAKPLPNPADIGRLAWYSSVTATVPLQNPGASAFDGEDLWVVGYYPLTVTKIDPRTNAVLATYNVGPSPAAVAFDGTDIWVARDNGSLLRLDRATGAVKATVAIQGGAYAMIFDGTSIWVSSTSYDTVQKIDRSTNTVTATIPVPGVPRALASDGTGIWVTGQTANSVSKIDAATNSLLFTIPLPGESWGIVFDGSAVWVTSGNNLVEIGPGASVIATVPVGYSPVAAASDGTYIWVANYGADTVSKVDPVSATVTQTISVGHFPVWVTYDGTNVWVSNTSDETGNSLSKIRP